MQAEIQERLRNALTGRSTVEMGQFQWVNLDMVRKEAGEDWDRLRRKIYNVSAQFIERRLDEGDVLLRAQGGFMLIFGEREGEEASEKVEEISLALNVFFLGDRILRKLKIEAEARSLSPEEFLQIVAVAQPMQAVDDDLDSEDILDEDGHEDGALANWRERKPGAAPSDIKRSAMRTTAPPPETDWQQEAVVPRDGSAPDWRKSDPKAPQAPGDGNWKSLDREAPDDEAVTWQEGRPSFSREKRPDWKEVEHQKPKSDATVARPVSVFVEPSAQWDDIIFRPCWDATQSVISLHFCLARREYRGQILYGRDTLLGNESSELHRALDRSVAIAAQRAFQQRYSEKALCALGIPVHYDSIAKVSDRVSYFSILQSVPQQMRKYFFLRVDGIPDGAPVSQMQELFRSMKGFGSNLLAKLKFGDRDLRRFEGCGIDYFGCDLPVNFGKPEKADKQVMALMEMVAAARLLKAETYLTEVSDFDALNMAVAGGVRLLSGDAVSQEFALPEPMRRVDIAELNAKNRPDEGEQDTVLL